MVISSNIAALSKVMNTRPDLTAGGMPSASSESQFQNVLGKLLTDTKGTASPSAAYDSINQEQLTLLVRALQLQMNSRLYNTVLNNGLEANYLAEKIIRDYGHHVGKMDSKASNNSQGLPKKDPAQTNLNIESVIQEAANKFDVDADLIRSVVKTESNYNPDAKSAKGAMGLMQLMPDTAKDLGVKNPYDIRENIMGGTRYLKTLLNRYDGHVDLALAAYNWGMGNLEKKPHNLPQETLQYITRVNSHYKG